eukprot:3409440-Pyramimonas_sp.AAC.1
MSRVQAERREAQSAGGRCEMSAPAEELQHDAPPARGAAADGSSKASPQVIGTLRALQGRLGPPGEDASGPARRAGRAQARPGGRRLTRLGLLPGPDKTE